MKIFFAIKNLSTAVGGAERVLCKVASLLANRGHETSIVTFDPVGSSSFYTMDPKIKRFYLPIGDSSSNSKLFESFLRLRALRKLIHNEKPDIVVGFMHSIYILLAFALIGISTPVIASEHIVIEHYKNKPIQFLLLLISSFFVNRYTSLSASIKKRYPYLISRKMIIIPNPIRDMKIKKMPKKNSNRKILLNIGRLENQKDHITLIKAFSKITKSFPEWDLKIIGSGSLRSVIEKEICSLNISNRVFIKSFTKNIESEYNQADVFVISSLYESFGLVTAEAMSSGLPCIGFSNCPGTNELIINEKTGLLVNDFGNRADSLAKGLKQLLSNEKNRINFGNAGRESISSKFSDKEVADSWDNLLYDVVINRCGFNI